MAKEVVHFHNTGCISGMHYSYFPACGRVSLDEKSVKSTDEKAKVTCKRCIRTKKYKGF